MRERALRPICACVKAPPDSVLRLVYLGVGWIMVLVITPIVGALPGPGGIFIFAGGLALLLKNSNWVKRLYTKYTRRFPRHGRLIDRILRRPSAPRGRARPERLKPPERGLKGRARSLVDFFSRHP